MPDHLELHVLNKNSPRAGHGGGGVEGGTNDSHLANGNTDSNRSSGHYANGKAFDADSAATQKVVYEEKPPTGKHQATLDIYKRRTDEEGGGGGGDDDDEYGEDEEPVIRTGGDVSRYLVRFDDAGDAALTFRGVILGNLFMIISAAVTYIYTVKPISLQLTSVFIQLAIWLLGLGWAKFMPGPDLVANRPRWKWLEPTLRFINPGPFGIKEHVVATIMGSSSTNGTAATDVLVTMKLFYGAKITPMMAVFGIFSISILGVGLVGVLRPLIVYPSEAVYYYTLPMVAIFQMLHYEEKGNRVRNFMIFFAATVVWEPIVSYICPWLNGISIFCLASMKAPMRVRKHIARIFGGASANQGLGYLSISLDPQYVSPSSYAGFPLKWQAMFWAGMGFGSVVMIIVYYANAFNAKTYPFLSFALFQENGTRYPLDAVFGNTYAVHQDALDTYGTPRLAATAVWAYFCQVLAIGALFTHVALFMGKDLARFWREQLRDSHHDPHYVAMKKYPEVPHWWYLSLFAAAIVGSFLTVGLSYTTLPWWGFLTALLLGCVITPFSATLYSQVSWRISQPRDSCIEHLHFPRALLLCLLVRIIHCYKHVQQDGGRRSSPRSARCKPLLQPLLPPGRQHHSGSGRLPEARHLPQGAPPRDDACAVLRNHCRCLPRLGTACAAHREQARYPSGPRRKQPVERPVLHVAQQPGRRVGPRKPSLCARRKLRDCAPRHLDRSLRARHPLGARQAVRTHSSPRRDDHDASVPDVHARACWWCQLSGHLCYHPRHGHAAVPEGEEAPHLPRVLLFAQRCHRRRGSNHRRHLELCILRRQRQADPLPHLVRQPRGLSRPLRGNQDERLRRPRRP